MGGRVTTDDHVAISDLLGRYCWAVDNGRGEDWAALWTEDGVLTGAEPQPVVGRAALTQNPYRAYAAFGGTMRHLLGNLHCDYGATRDVVHARFYNWVSTWKDGGVPVSMAVCEAVFVRHGDGWLIQSNHIDLKGWAPQALK